MLAGAFGVGAIIGAFATGRLDGRRLPSAVLLAGLVIYATGTVALAMVTVP